MNCPNLRSNTILYLVTILILPLLFLPAPAAADAGKSGGVYRIPLGHRPDSLDPAYYTDIYSFNVAHSLYDGLVEFDEKLSVIPSIARRWKISRDHRTYTFLLRKGVKFHNGRTVKASDFVYSFTRILSPETKSPAAWFFTGIKGAKAFQEGKAATVEGLTAVDPTTLRIELEKPFAPFLSIMAMVNAKVIPREAVGEDFARNPVGTGPFRFVSWKPGKSIELAANKDYFNGRPHLDALSFKVYPQVGFEEIFRDFEAGLLEQAIIPSASYEKVLAENQNKRFTIVSKPGLNLVYVGIISAFKPLNDRRVRQALNYAVDTDTIVKEITRRGSIPAKGILPPGIPGFNPRFERYPYDPEKAKALLAEAGYPGGKGIPPLEILRATKRESVKKEMAAYTRYLAEIGIQLVPKVADSWQAFIKRVNAKEVPLYYAAWYADYPDADNFLYVLCNSKSKTNRMGFSDPVVDGILEDGREKSNYMERVKLYQQAEERIKEQSPIISQHTNSVNYIFQPEVKNLKLNHLGAIYLPFRHVWLDRGKAAGN